MRRRIVILAGLLALCLSGTALAASYVFTHWEDQLYLDTGNGAYGTAWFKCVCEPGVAHYVSYLDMDGRAGFSPGDKILNLADFRTDRQRYGRP